MSAEIKAYVTRINDIVPHPNADRLDIAIIEGWTVIVQKDTYKPNDLVVYFPMDLKIKEKNAIEMGVDKYLHRKIDINGDKVLVVGKQKIRGVLSFGFTSLPSSFFAEGEDVSEFYGASKYEPPVKVSFGSGKFSIADPNFPTYTDIQNYRNNTKIFESDEIVYITEKIHGTNFRCGYYLDNSDNKIYITGSRRTIREIDDTLYSIPMNDPRVKKLLNYTEVLGYRNVIIYGEIYGKGIQHLDYNANVPKFVVFDIKANNQFVNPEEMFDICKLFDIPTVPLLYIGSFGNSNFKSLSESDTVLGNNKHLMEGVVIKPKFESFNPVIGRKVLKYISNRYLGKDLEENTDY